MPRPAPPRGTKRAKYSAPCGGEGPRCLRRCQRWSGAPYKHQRSCCSVKSLLLEKISSAQKNPKQPNSNNQPNKIPPHSPTIDKRKKKKTTLKPPSQEKKPKRISVQMSPGNTDREFSFDKTLWLWFYSLLNLFVISGLFPHLDLLVLVRQIGWLFPWWIPLVK